jgi:hypothetical protein
MEQKSFDWTLASLQKSHFLQNADLSQLRPKKFKTHKDEVNFPHLKECWLEAQKLIKINDLKSEETRLRSELENSPKSMIALIR